MLEMTALITINIELSHLILPCKIDMIDMIDNDQSRYTLMDTRLAE